MDKTVCIVILNLKTKYNYYFRKIIQSEYKSYDINNRVILGENSKQL